MTAFSAGDFGHGQGFGLAFGFALTVFDAGLAFTLIVVSALGVGAWLASLTSRHSPVGSPTSASTAVAVGVEAGSSTSLIQPVRERLG